MHLVFLVGIYAYSRGRRKTGLKPAFCRWKFFGETWLGEKKIFKVGTG